MLVLIYILVVAWFKDFTTPLVIMTPIPLTLIGIVLGHWLFGAPFTATSMIGFIALAGVSAEFGVIMLLYLKHAWEDQIAAGQASNAGLLRAIGDGAGKRGSWLSPFVF